MKKKLTLSLCALLLFLVCSNSVSAITWIPKEFTCPIDNEKNTFLVVGSYGSYIYNYPSKYQWLFFPDTSGNNFYMCKKCHLTTYMWDFDRFPKQKIEAVKKVLATIEQEKFTKYNKVAVTKRLEVMEKVYGELDKDEIWWERFNRIKGFHYGKAGEADKARAARLKSLETIKSELNKGNSKTPKKILYYVSGALKHFLNDDAGARADFDKALQTRYAKDGAKSGELKNAEANLNQRLNDYIKVMYEEKNPRSADRDPGHSH
ncbi:MAG: hypothetical protein HKN33_16550 [Pyrinomonadaceae bacterium]|nr:hypothetical protein [Pyrinomonadaceae bacterium]